tara:strand:+ start:616 stop:876 length:261 start_codon:yes stop_codon:yes gene_type:complete
MKAWRRFKKWMWWRGISWRDLCYAAFAMGMMLAVIVIFGAILLGCAPKQVEEPRYTSTLYEVEFPEEDLDDLPEADTGEAAEEDDE